MIKTHSIFERPIAHRGLWDDKIPENSLAAFRAAITAGYAIEFDVQMTRDRKLVVFHDYDTVRMTGKKRWVRQQTHEDLQQTQLLGTEERIPTLAEALDLIAGQVPVLIEMKGRGAGQHIVRRVKEEIRNYQGDVAVSSFNPLIVRWCHRLMPTKPCGQNFKNFYTRGLILGFLLRHLSRLLWDVFGVVPDFFVMKANALPSVWMTKVIAKHEKPLLTWAPSTTEECVRVQQYVDNVICEKDGCRSATSQRHI